MKEVWREEQFAIMHELLLRVQAGLTGYQTKLWVAPSAMQARLYLFRNSKSKGFLRIDKWGHPAHFTLPLDGDNHLIEDSTVTIEAKRILGRNQK